MKSILSLVFVFVIAVSAFFPGNGLLQSDDWPQILGPSRNGESREKLLAAWPKTGPRQLWKKKCGEGFAGVAVKNDQVILFHRIGAKDIVECLSAKDGKLIWKQEFEAVYKGGFSSDLGPRCVPVIYADSVFLYGAGGTLRRLKLRSGEQLWSRNLFEDFKANEGYFGAGSTPVVTRDTLVVMVGGRTAGIVGLNWDGETIWKTEPETASYAAPVELTYRGRKSVACVSKFSVKIVDLGSGKVVLSQDFGARGPTVNAAMPLVFDGKLFVSAAYRVGARMISLPSGKTIWENDLSMSSQYTTCVIHEGYLIGCHGREDFGNGALRCVRVTDGKVVWEEPGSGICHVIKAGDKALVWTIDGALKLIKIQPSRYELLAEARIFTKNSKSLPALSNGRLFVKSNGDEGAGELTCLQVGQ
ncbi:MAG: PQQ-binding-like beta-propeller repeat protein [Planctomycetota bacterium]|nr:PQQ-binding-like beta-propeller repeat protein [Planctomycetota bacterium]